ncbi:MAG: hypothetical protein JJ892_08900 [Balneola sp.]|nr:hypothetical protein [Balneola sp.]MBO6650227.1 hypothetical protein [Balneola sp.]MBO6712188.1 hypothetical protein [Balneola sp.]MBO6800382.1 hypothetical protein [Balneola sp.]MBO6871826.1 hypothetical protein [Balneola sp.]
MSKTKYQESLFRDVIKVYDQKKTRPFEYLYLVEISIEKSDIKKAGKYLKEGKEKYPDSIEIAYADINYSIATEPELVEEKAKTYSTKHYKEPSLILYSASYFEQLSQLNRDNNDNYKAQLYFDIADRFYSYAIAFNNKNSIPFLRKGLLYYKLAVDVSKNQDSDLTTKMNLKSKDEDLKREAMGMASFYSVTISNSLSFALSNFKKAENLDPYNLITLSVIASIFENAFKDEQMSLTVRTRMKLIQSGGKIESSLF